MADRLHETSVLTFSGPATIASCHDIHARLLAALEADGDVAVECSGISEMDISFVQMLLAARRSAEARRKRLTLASPAQGVLLETLSRAGLIGPPSNGSGLDDGFWKGGPP
jgi:anti-anti-sigma regulatory factor